MTAELCEKSQKKKKKKKYIAYGLFFPQRNADVPACSQPVSIQVSIFLGSKSLEDKSAVPASVQKYF